MDPEIAVVGEVNEFNLDNYFPLQSSYNTVTYVHKRFLKKPKKECFNKEIIQNQKVKDRIVKEDKAVNCNIKNSKTKKERRNDSILQHTIKFAKTLVPLAIPPSEGNDTPVFYTIKTSSKCKRKDNQEAKCEKHDNITFEKKRSKKVIDIYRKGTNILKESDSTKYSATNCSQSTLDDVNTNQSMCYTFSDTSERKEKNHKNLMNKKRRRDFDKVRMSESFECLATELNNQGETKIKINLMNDKEKHHLSESIRIPIVNALHNCIKEANDMCNNSEIKEDVKCLQKCIKSNSQKIDLILNKLICIEKYLANTNARIPCSPKLPKKMSRLEQLGEDIIQEKESSFEDELPQMDSNREKNEIDLVREDKRSGCGEIPKIKASTSVGVRTDKHRLPTRFCWTDAENRTEF